MKKILLILLFVTLFTFGCVVEKEELVDKESGLVGIWVMDEVKPGRNDDSILEAMSIQFKEDGTCLYSYRSLVGESHITFEGKVEGTCYLNSSKNKFILKTEEGKSNPYFSKWKSIEIDSDYMTIDNMGFDKKA